MDLVGKPNNTSPICNNFHLCHPSVFVQVSSSSRDRKRPAFQVCIQNQNELYCQVCLHIPGISFRILLGILHVFLKLNLHEFDIALDSLV